MALPCGKLKQNKTERGGVGDFCLDKLYVLSRSINTSLISLKNSVWVRLKEPVVENLQSIARAACWERFFQTFCRARQPRYHAVDETEAVHKHGGAFSAWSCSRTSFRCRTSLHEFKLHRRRGLWNGLVRRALSSLGVSFSQQVQMRFAPPNVVRFCSFQSNNFFILALFLFIAQLRIK